jgi:hypothetical protein
MGTVFSGWQRQNEISRRLHKGNTEAIAVFTSVCASYNYYLQVNYLLAGFILMLQVNMK